MALAAPPREISLGSVLPRVAPPLPAKSLVKEFVATARSIGITLYPWQELAARYITAIGPDGKWLFPEVAIIVARQNGKTEILKPYIMQRLAMGRRIMHTAQNRDLPRDVHSQVADLISQDESQFKHRNGRPLRPRFANGQEAIELHNGAVYRIVAPTRGGARGPSSDDVIVDELREMKDHDFIKAAEPTLLASDNPQMIYLSNAGEADSEVLNALQQRAAEDPNLAYLEWSADPSREVDDREGWREANPSLGHRPGVMEYLERKYESYRMAGTLYIFETEHLCRSVVSMAPGLVTEFSWRSCKTDEVGEPTRPFLGVALDPSGKRASAAIAWQRDDGLVAYRELLEASDPNVLDIDAFGHQLRVLAGTHHVRGSAYSSASDVVLARYLVNPESVDGQKFANASSHFAALVEGRKLRWTDADALSEDLRYTTRKERSTGVFSAERSDENHPITASLAAIRATWLASAPRPPLPTRF